MDCVIKEEISSKYKTGLHSIRQLAKIYNSSYEKIRVILKEELKSDYKSAANLSNENSIKIAKSYKLEKFCVNCKKLLENNDNYFCSRHCSAIFNNKNFGSKTDKVKKKISETLKRKYEFSSKEEKKKHSERSRLANAKIHFPKTLIKRTNCSCCNKEFWATGTHKNRKFRKCCSDECARINSLKHNNGNHKYTHKNGSVVSLDSSWEVEIANWLDENNLNWTRPKYIFWIDCTGKNRKYFPDFYLIEYDIYLDPKNPYQITTTLDKLDFISKRYKLIYGSVEYIKEQIQKVITE